MLKTTGREGFVKTIIFVVILMAALAVLYFGFTAQGDVDLRAIKETISNWTSQVTADEKLLLASENRLRDFNKMIADVIKESVDETVLLEKSKSEINQLADEYNTIQNQISILTKGFEETKAVWVEDENTILSIGGCSLSKKEHQRNLEDLEGESTFLNEKYNTLLSKINYQEQRVEMLADDISMLKLEKSEWELKIEQFKVKLLKNRRVIEDYKKNLEGYNGKSYKDFLAQGKVYDDAFEKIGIEAKALNNYGTKSTYSSGAKNYEYTDSDEATNLLPKVLSKVN